MSPAVHSSTSLRTKKCLAQVFIAKVANVKVVPKIIIFDGKPLCLSLSISLRALGAVGWKSIGLGRWYKRFRPCVTMILSTIMFERRRAGISCCKIEIDKMNTISSSYWNTPDATNAKNVKKPPPIL